MANVLERGVAIADRDGGEGGSGGAEGQWSRSRPY
jgi:hypothetical protein